MKIIAHRGASEFAPENTIVAFKKALSMGAKAFEFDVQMTKDHQLVVIHDYKLDRTTSGKGLVMATKYKKIRKLDAGIWFGKAYKGCYVPLLEEVLDLLIGETEIHIEIKKSKYETRDLETAVYDLVASKNMLKRVIFSSFNQQVVKKLNDIQGARVGLLLSSSIADVTTYMKDQGLLGYSLHQSVENCSKELVEEVHSNGQLIFIYTVNDKDAAKQLEEMGVDGLFSNNPRLLDENIKGKYRQ